MTNMIHTWCGWKTQLRRSHDGIMSFFSWVWGLINLHIKMASFNFSYFFKNEQFQKIHVPIPPPWRGFFSSKPPPLIHLEFPIKHYTVPYICRSYRAPRVPLGKSSQFYDVVWIFSGRTWFKVFGKYMECSPDKNYTHFNPCYTKMFKWNLRQLFWEIS